MKYLYILSLLLFSLLSNEAYSQTVKKDSVTSVSFAEEYYTGSFMGSIDRDYNYEQMNKKMRLERKAEVISQIGMTTCSVLLIGTLALPPFLDWNPWIAYPCGIALTVGSAVPFIMWKTQILRQIDEIQVIDIAQLSLTDDVKIGAIRYLRPDMGYSYASIGIKLTKEF